MWPYMRSNLLFLFKHDLMRVTCFWGRVLGVLDNNAGPYFQIVCYYLN